MEPPLRFPGSCSPSEPHHEEAKLPLVWLPPEKSFFYLENRLHARPPEQEAPHMNACKQCCQKETRRWKWALRVGCERPDYRPLVAFRSLTLRFREASVRLSKIMGIHLLRSLPIRYKLGKVQPRVFGYHSIIRAPGDGFSW